MGKTFQSGIISRLVVGGGTYAVLHNETQIDVDNSNGLPTIIKLQPIDPSLGQCTVYINDYGNNSSVGNITIVASGGNLINGQPTLVLDTDGIGAEISVSDQKNFIASLNNDSQGGGGTITGANNGLTVFGTDIQLGGNLIMPTTIDALGVNTLSINDVSGLFLQTRDALGNFFFNNIGGTGTLVGSSQYIFSYLGDGGNVFTDSLIVINFGGANNFTQAVDFWNFGDYTQSESSFNVRNFGRKNYYFFGIDGNVFGSYNTVDTLSSFSVIGDNNILSNGVNISIFGNGNNYHSINDKVILGNNNNNLIIDGVTGILNSNATYNNTSFAHLNNIVGVDMNGDFYNTGLNASAVLTGAGLPNYVSKWTSGSDLTISQLFDNGTDVGINTITPSAKLHLKGIDATSFNYALKVDNSASSPLLYVRNDGNVGIGTTSPTAKLQVAGSFIVDGKINTNTNIISTSGVDTIDWGSCELKYNTSIGLNWYSRLLKDGFNNNTLKWSNEIRIKSYLNPVADLMGDDADLRILGDPTGTAGNGLYFKATNSTLNWRTTLKILNNGSGEPFVNIIGGDSTASNYALKVDNSASSPLLYVKNDGYVNVGLGNITLGVHTAAPSVSAIFMGVIPNGDNYSIAQIGGATYINGVNTVSYTVNGSVKGITNSTYTQFTQPFAIGTLAPSGSNAFVVSGESYLRGISSTSADYALKVDNSSLSSLLKVRNDGLISMPSLQIGNVGLVSGDLYVDTSANILANGDLVVGRKV